MWLWLAQHSTAVTAIAAAVQTLVAIAIFIATWRYVRWTKRLVETTNDLVRATENQVSLSEGLVRATENQLKLQERHLRANLYDRYDDVFHAVMGFLAELRSTLTVERRYLDDLIINTRAARFLFGREVNDFIRNLRERAVEYHFKAADGRNSATDLGMVEFAHWVTSTALEEAEKLFAPYLNLSEKDIYPTR